MGACKSKVKGGGASLSVNSASIIHLDAKIKKRIQNGEDIIGRKERYLVKKIDKTYPEYILKNKELYKDWIVI